MRSAMLHLVGDTAASVGVAIAGALILATGGLYWLDPLVSMAIGLLIAYQAWKLPRSTTDVLLESTPQGMKSGDIIAQVVGAAVKVALGARFGIAHATIELECEACSPVGDWCAIEGTTVLVHSVPPGRTQ